MSNFPPNKLKAINAAIDEFQKNGFKHTSMSSIAKATGITKKELRTYFFNKDDVFKYVFLELYGRIAPQLQDIMDGDMTVREKIRHFIHNYVTFINDYHFLPLGLVRKHN